MKEVIRENLTPAQVLEIRKEAKREGATVNVVRLHSQLVEIEITYPNRIIDVMAKRIGGAS
ncbi:hypothetical protein [Thiolinea disciformis]|uniref:hypothetical protein n=1 Tax=Thiolinea disciformis TaxID=125614 RepID=UPI0003782A30|nr:hypothetical protein [Thiolinea disciformis]